MVVRYHQWPFLELDDNRFAADSLAMVEAELRCVAARREERGDAPEVATLSPVEESRSVGIVVAERKTAMPKGGASAAPVDEQRKKRKGLVSNRLLEAIRQAMDAIDATGNKNPYTVWKLMGRVGRGYSYVGRGVTELMKRGELIQVSGNQYRRADVDQRILPVRETA